MTNSEKFLETVVQTLSDRGQSYGSPHELFDDVAKRWSLTLGADEVTSSHICEDSFRLFLVLTFHHK